MSTALTEAQRALVRYHLGYPNTSPAASLQLGIPAQQQTLFMVEQAMNVLLPVMVPKVLQILGVLDGLDCQIAQAQQYLVAKKLDSMELRDGHPDLLENEYRRWAFRLAETLGCPVYPYAERFNPQVVNGSQQIQVVPRSS